MANSVSTYPNPTIDPRDKDYDYILRYAQSAWSDGRAYTPSTMFYYGHTRLNEIRTYALGKQSVNKYKKILLGDDQVDRTSYSVDWSPISFLTKFREIAISKIMQRSYDVECITVDPLAKSEEDAFFNQMKVKIMAREAVEQAGGNPDDFIQLRIAPGDPQDEEQLKMQMKFGYKHQMAMESELGISLIQFQNNMDEARKRTIENSFDYGLGGYKDWIDERGMVKFREVMPQNLITSYCVKNDFSDAKHIGEVIFLDISDIAPYFDTDQMLFILKAIAGKYGNPNNFPIQYVPGREWDKFKVAVWDLEFKDYDTTVYKKEIDNRANIRINKSDYANLGNNETIEFFKGQPEPKYLNTTRQVIRKTKWIIGTEMMYDWGLSINNKVKKSSWWKTDMSYHLYAWNFNNMQFTGITERLMPLEDDLCLTWYRLQNLKNKLVPYLIKLDINALEGVNFGKGGKKMTPAELVDFMLQEFIVVYRSTDLLSKNPNYDPARIEATGQLQAFKLLYEHLQAGLQLMRDVTGLNELTDGSTPNAKTLVPVANAAIDSTNNALYLLMNADKQLMNSLCDAIVQRIQVAVKLGKVEGYAKALGSDTVRFYQISPDISNYELGIFVRDAPTYEERQAFYQDLNLKDSQGLIDPQDKLIVMSCTNLKQAGELLAYNIQKRKEEAHQQQMELVQQQTQGNAQIAQMTEQMKQQTIGVQLQADLIRIQTEMEWQYRIEGMKKQADVTGEKLQADARTIGHEIQASAKVQAQTIASQGDLLKAHLSGEKAKEKQEIANKKPMPKKTA